MTEKGPVHYWLKIQQIGGWPLLDYFSKIILVKMVKTTWLEPNYNLEIFANDRV